MELVCFLTISIALAVSNFFEICRDIRSSRFTTGVVDTGVVDTGVKRKKSSIRQVLVILFGKFATSVNDSSGTGDKICRWCH
jgi:hypothetical protein